MELELRSLVPWVSTARVPALTTALFFTIRYLIEFYGQST